MIYKICKSLNFRFARFVRILRKNLRILFPRGFARDIEYVYRKNSSLKDTYDLYQQFYVNALEEFVRFCILPDIEKYSPSNLGEYPLCASHFNGIGQYAFLLKNGIRVRVAIDADDHPSIQNQKILDWADVYFKTNLWPDWKYPKKVRPIVTGNSMVNMDSIVDLKSLRKLPRLYDFIFVSRIYAGPGANVEHNIRLFEELAKIPCRSKIRAIFMGFPKGDPEMHKYWNRLETAGVEASMDHFSFNELMTMSAQSRLCVIRLGIHSCITWRLINMLCIGAAVVLDANPFSSWPEPLREGENFLSLGLRITPECGPAPKEDYDSIVCKMQKFLNDKTILQKIGENNALYFDEYAHPFKVAQYVLEKVKENR